jgi:outer membrane protein assembly factor BamB
VHAGETGDSADHYWPAWRGPLATGVAPHADPPIEWGEDHNVEWKTELPGRGHSSPVVWGDRIFLTSALPIGETFAPRYSNAPGAHDNVPVTRRHRFVALAISRQSGEVLWERTLKDAIPHEGGHYTGSLASASPVTDGELVFAFFGSHGLYCLDLDGRLQWEADLGRMQSKHGHGEGSSPVLAGETLVVNWDHEGQSFVVALDKRTGDQVWKNPRDEVTSWASPVIVEHQGRRQVVIAGTGRLRAYDLESGDVVWECGGLSANVVASPVAADGIVIAGSSYDTRAMLAVRLEGARGDVTRTDNLIWRRTERTPYVPSPLLYEDSIYFLRHYQGILSRVSIHTGEDESGPFRLYGITDVYSSPVAAAGRIYITDRDGTTLVMTHEAPPRSLAVNRLDDSFSATPALVDRELYLRGARRLYKIAAD